MAGVGAPGETHADDDRKLRELLVTAREAKGLTQTELGRRLGRDQVTVAKIEAGSRRIDPAEFFAIIRAIDVDFDEFTGMLKKSLGVQQRRQLARRGSRRP